MQKQYYGYAGAITAEVREEEYIRFVYIFDEPDRREEVLYIGTRENVRKCARGMEFLNIELELADAVTVGSRTFKIIGIERVPPYETVERTFQGGMVTYYFSEANLPLS
ncbi:hypothetical protein [Marinococcus luteus]|uniref:hypothetical protein n=1 Tax=Marinococcus luteus TaxID=1122204 RepID=UPI002ACCB3BA|nr:hypothetical protein [Marinococcus luteus]MDZ5782148.1 hypothetical protein [Marinococcus luteus]